MVIGIVIKKAQAITLDLESGRSRRKIGKRGALHAASDGVCVAIFWPGKQTQCYSVTGRYLTQVGAKNVASLNLVNRTLVVGYHDGQRDIFDLSSYFPQEPNPIKRIQALANKCRNNKNSRGQ